MVPRTELRLLLGAMSQPGTFYVLGAGTSAGIVPFTAGTLSFVRRLYVELGTYSATAPPVTPFSDRVLWSPMAEALRRGEGSQDDLILEALPTSTLEFLAQKCWSPDLRAPIPPQYSILRKVCRPSVFFSFNLDGLARQHLRNRHLVFEPHGTVDRIWTEHSEFDRLLEWSLDGPLPSLGSKILPGPEPAFITRTRVYEECRAYLRAARAVVILGYSFGSFRGRMDDAESFEFLMDTLAKNACPVFIVDPNPYPLANCIEERLRRPRIVPVMLRWDIFSSGLLTAMQRYTSLSALLADLQHDAVLDMYGRCLDERI